MLCPSCKIPLVMADRQGVEIDYCPTCRGVWLDRGELDKIIDRAAPDSRPAQARGAGEAPAAASFLPQTPYPPTGRRGDDHRGDYYRKRRKSFLSEMFDFD